MSKAKAMPLDDAVFYFVVITFSLLAVIAPDFIVGLTKGEIKPGLIWGEAKIKFQKVIATTASFEKALKITLGEEGGLNTNPADRGGRTMKGVTQSTFSAYREKRGLDYKKVDDITDEELRDLYHSDYWLAAGCDKMADPLATVCFDTAVNFGVAGALTFFHDLPSDPVKAAILIAERREAYRYERVREAPDQEVFREGWIARDRNMKKYAEQYGAGIIANPKTDPTKESSNESSKEPATAAK